MLVKTNLQNSYNICDQSPVPCFDLRECFVVILVLLLALHLQQRLLQHKEAVEHEVGRVPPCWDVLPAREKSIKLYLHYNMLTSAAEQLLEDQVQLVPRADRCRSWSIYLHACKLTWVLFTCNSSGKNHLQSFTMRAIEGFRKMQSPIHSWRTWQIHFPGLKWAGRSGTNSLLKIAIWLLAVSETIISVTWLNRQSSNSFTTHSAMLLALWRSEKGAHPRTRACLFQSEVM